MFCIETDTTWGADRTILDWSQRTELRPSDTDPPTHFRGDSPMESPDDKGMISGCVT